MSDSHTKLQTFLCRSPCIESDASRGKIEHFRHRGAKSTRIRGGRFPKHDGIGAQPCHFVGRTSQSDSPRLAGERRGICDGIPDGVDIGIAGLEISVDQNVPFRIDGEPGFLRDAGIRGYSYGEDHQIGISDGFAG